MDPYITILETGREPTEESLVSQKHVLRTRVV